jgi:hypothetical protein
MAMKVSPKSPPRTFHVGQQGRITLRHCADVELDADEQVTFVTPFGAEHDVVRKSWGYYATGSLNGRLREHGLKSALVVNSAGRLYLLLVEIGREAEFARYLEEEQQRLLVWLDDDEHVARLIAAFPISPNASRSRGDG